MNKLVIEGIEFKFGCDVSGLQNKVDALLIALKLSGAKYGFFSDTMVDNRDDVWVYNLAILNKVNVMTGSRRISSNFYIKYIEVDGDKVAIGFTIHPNLVLLDNYQSFDSLDSLSIVSIEKGIEDLTMNF